MIASGLQFEQRFFFLPGPNGDLFASLRCPIAGKKCKGVVFCVVPFAEEMNRCRRLLAEQSRLLASEGFTVLCVDLSGTGDSAGEFGEANWDLWQQDLRYARSWLESEYGEVNVVWAIRFGALLALSAFANNIPRRFLLWQPMLHGDSALNELLRVSVARSFLDGRNERSTVDQLKADVLGGQSLEVGGYIVNPVLAQALNSAVLTSDDFGDAEIVWMDVVSEDGDASSQERSNIVEKWQADGSNLRYIKVQGRRYWSLPEVADCAELSKATSVVLNEYPCPD